MSYKSGLQGHLDALLCVSEFFTTCQAVVAFSPTGWSWSPKAMSQGNLGSKKGCFANVLSTIGLAICSQKIRVALTVGCTPLQKGHSLQQQPGALGADAGLKMMVEPGYTACPTATWSLPSKGHAIACNF